MATPFTMGQMQVICETKSSNENSAQKEDNNESHLLCRGGGLGTGGSV